MRWGGGHQRWGTRWRDDGRSSKGSVTAGAGGDHRSGPSAGTIGRRDRLGVSRSTLCQRCAPGPGQPGLPTRLVAGLVDPQAHAQPVGRSAVRAWLENPYYQFFCGELSFCHRLRFDRSSLTHWRQRLGAEQLVCADRGEPVVAHKTGAASRDLERVVVDTTVQPKAIAHPTDARRAIAHWKNGRSARRDEARLRQSYRRVAKRAAIMVGRYTHAHQFKRARRSLSSCAFGSAGDPRHPSQDRRQ